MVIVSHFRLHCGILRGLNCLQSSNESLQDLRYTSSPELSHNAFRSNLERPEYTAQKKVAEAIRSPVACDGIIWLGVVWHSKGIIALADSALAS